MSVRIIILAAMLVFIGFVLEHWQLPGLLNGLAIPWMLLVMTALIISAPQYFGLLLAVALGILLDVEHSQPLGLNACLLVFHTLLVQLNLRRFRLHGWAMVLAVVPILILLDMLFVNLLLLLLGASFTLPIWQPFLSSFVVWPLFYALYQYALTRMHLR